MNATTGKQEKRAVNVAVSNDEVFTCTPLHLLKSFWNSDASRSLTLLELGILDDAMEP